MRRSTALFVALLAGAAAMTATGCGDEPLPVMVTYGRDIQPLMVAHCVRCHGAGGTLNADPDIIPPSPTSPYQGAPKNGWFTGLDNPGPGKLGLYFYTTPGGGRSLMDTALPFMPPPPSDALTDREYNLLVTWLSNPQ